MPEWGTLLRISTPAGEIMVQIATIEILTFA
jgi:hypothetical protein